MVINRPFAVYRTNADFEQLELSGSSKVRDIAESIMDREFQKHNCQCDYMVIDAVSQEMYSNMLSSETISKRGECQS
jgi:hypothetical protein